MKKKQALSTDGYILVKANGLIKDFPLTEPLRNVVEAGIKGLDAQGEQAPLMESIRISTSLFGFDADNKGLLDFTLKPWIQCMMQEGCSTLPDGPKPSAR